MMNADTYIMTLPGVLILSGLIVAAYFVGKDEGRDEERRRNDRRRAYRNNNQQQKERNK
jgi:hypothetical protein